MIKRVIYVRFSVVYILLGIGFRICKWVIRRVMIKKGWIEKQPWENA